MSENKPHETLQLGINPTASDLTILPSSNNVVDSNITLQTVAQENTPTPILPATTEKSGRDDEALSSLLLLLKSNSSKDEEAAGSTNDPNGNRRVSTSSVERSSRGDGNQPLSKTVKLEDLRQYFHLPIVEVAKQLGTCTTALKKICRKNKIKKWPYRQIRSITKSVQSLEMASMNDSLADDLRLQYREQILALQKAIDDLIRDPNTPISLVDMKLFADDIDDDELESKVLSSVSTDVHQIMQAAAATAGIEASSRSASSLLKRKNLSATASSTTPAEPPPPAKVEDEEPIQHIPLIGATIVSQLPYSSTGKHKIIFMPPVQLAPLQRKKMNTTKKLVPLIEPDICNHFEMDFLPHSILKFKVMSPSPETAVAVAIAPTPETDGEVTYQQSGMDYPSL